MATARPIAVASAPAAGRYSNAGFNPAAAIFRGPFASPQYRRFWFAGLLSFTAFWIQMITRSWLVQDMTGSPFLVSLIPVTMLLPMLIVSLPAGIIADRANRRYVILAMESLAFLGYGAITIVSIVGGIAVWNILLLSALTGVVMALAGPSRMAMIPSLVPDTESRRAIGLSSLVFNLAQIAGPAVGGVIIGQFGTEYALATSMFVSIPALLLYTTVRPEAEAKRRHCKEAPLESLKHGFRYTLGNPAIRSMLLGATIIVVTIATWGALMPTFAEDVLMSGPEVLGLLTLAMGVGALIGSLLSVAMSGRASHERVESVAAAALVASVIGFAMSPWLELSLLFAALAGLSQTTYMVTNMTVMQMSSSEEYRGRVLSIRFLAIGLQPAGTLALGLLAEVIGPQLGVFAIAVFGAVAYGLLQVFTRHHRAEAMQAEPLRLAAGAAAK